MRIRRFYHSIFQLAPYYVDHDGGCFGMFQVPAQARRAAAIYKQVQGEIDAQNYNSVNSNEQAEAFDRALTAFDLQQGTS